MLQDDYELTRENIQDLSTRDALAAFFAKLGYNTNERLPQHTAAMGFGSELLKSAITSLERLASEDGGLLEVYLIELKSVNVAVTRALAQAFRNLSVLHPLLVLTDDYQRLDFVLVERYTVSSFQESTISALPAPLTRQVGVRPRVLTINRLKPGDIELRVLRRFSYTESDALAQYDKLLSAYDVAEWSEPFFNNRALFSDYYLTQRLPESKEWRNPAEAAAMTRAYKTLRDLYADVRETFANQPGTLVRSNLLVPALQALGFSIQPARTDQQGDSEPPYRLSAASNTSPLALCLTYCWGRNLDGKDDQRDSETPDENPGAVVVSLLDRGEADWAIVTNGKLWRLYSAKAHSRATNYYEIDLEETMAQLPEHRELAFRYFWYFFRIAAFLPHSAWQPQGPNHPATLPPATTFRSAPLRSAPTYGPFPLCFLDSLVSESERYARELGERLKERVFFEIFPHFARGFILSARRTGQLPADLDTLPDDERSRLLEPFFSGTLTFLYRLLFLLYAESRDLLPVREVRGYYQKSLEQLKREIAAKAGPIEDQAPAHLKAAYNELSTTLYDRLQDLFHAVDRGEPALNVPVYNGGLFITQPDAADPSPEAAVARFLATCKIPDRQLALGLDRMARDLDEKRQDLAFIDYKSLGVRQLGSIYEGLLEFKLHIAPEMMAVVKGKKTEEIVSYDEAQQKKLSMVREGRGKDAHNKTLPKGAVYLENDRRERKATGSYYTPDYIVKYIVEHTVGPVLNEKLEALRPIFREAEKTLRAERDKVKALRREDISAERETYKKFHKTLGDAFFDLKVLDPAMGSGHFLVEAVDYITDQMAKFLIAFKWNPVIYELAQTRREIQEEMEYQGITIDMSKLTDLNLLKRRVLKSCIYGVDLNPMAVELAKVSLWLDCFTLGAPLSFLDHHMKCGNSLIGGSIQEVQDALSRDLFGHQFAGLLQATELMRHVGELSDVTAQEIAESRKAYKGAYDALAPFKRLLDVWISEYFGNKKAQHTTRVYAGAIVADNYSKANAEDKQAIETALALANTKRFFHWELEFPEVFYDETKRKEHGGFDAVVGNPPYRVLIKSQVGADLLQYYNKIYKAAQYNPNLFALVIERAISISRFDTFLSFIIPSLWLTNAYFSQLRRVMAETCQIVQFVDLGFGVFQEVVETSIFFARRTSKREPYKLTLAAKGTQPEQIDGLPLVVSSEEITKGIETGFAFFSQRGDLEARFASNTDLLADSFVVYRGVETRDNEKYLATELLSPDYKPILMGTDVNRYVCAWTESYVKFIPKELKSNADILMYDVPEKVLLRRTGSQLIAGFDIERLLAIKNLYVLIPRQKLSAKFLLTLLNSRLLNHYNQSVLGNAGEAFAQLKKSDVEDFPIRRINFTTPPTERAYYLEKARNLYGYCLSKDDQLCVTGFVEHHLSQEPEQSDVVHDLLAFLAEEMMRLNKEKRAAQQEFLDWLVTTLKLLPDKDGRKGIDVLVGKSKVADYPGGYQKGEPPLATDELLDILRKNKSRVGVSLSDAGLVDRIKRMYEGSLQRVLPIKERLKKTDALIDAVVYRLYGLGEEEVKIIEGKG